MSGIEFEIKRNYNNPEYILITVYQIFKALNNDIERAQATEGKG